tara:strand:- start:192 stop:572 length:381 start_codon:yes stop_codon:yes gene_type:complete
MASKMDDKTEIAKIIKLYFDSMYHSNAKLVKKVFHPAAKITGYVEDKLEEMDVNEFANFVGEQKPSPANKNDPEMLEIVSIDIAGKTAVALVRDDHLGVTYLDTLSFLKIDKNWVIYNKLFHVERG